MFLIIFIVIIIINCYMDFVFRVIFFEIIDEEYLVISNVLIDSL